LGEVCSCKAPKRIAGEKGFGGEKKGLVREKGKWKSKSFIGCFLLERGAKTAEVTKKISNSLLGKVSGIGGTEEN